MRVHRTAPLRAFAALANSLSRDRRLSWGAVGVLTYLLGLPNGAWITERVLAAQRGEGCMSIVASLRELEERRYLRRVVRRDPVTRQYSTTCEVFEKPYEFEALAGELQEVHSVAA
ncbi:hypothetical protein [Streptomyces shenzhenensis]|uniref:hypothetical protein n=1 Tax=Streptomyces shenzhenensis TaxID=943815 RepID=UPI0015F0CE64|nr:hypothetical protein [Streptomyces shenzhenensis]